MTLRFCPACRERLAVVREGGRLRRRCRACGFTFYGNPVPAVVGIVVQRGRLLLARRARPPYAGTWDLPGGFLEAGELPEPALRREMREELGLRVEQARLVGFASDRYGPRGFPVLTVVYRVIRAAGTVTAADDVGEARWFALAGVPWREIRFPGMRRLLRAHLRERGR